MSIIEPILLGIVLSADSFSAAIAMGLRPHRFGDSLKFAFASGGAELIATLIGAVAGEAIISQFSSIAHWIAFSLLFIVAIHMLYEGFKDWRNSNNSVQSVEFHRFTKLIIVAIATSLDALAIGVSLGVSNKPLVPYLVSIGGWAFFSTIVGMGIARKIPEHLSVIFNVIGALILGVLAVNVLKI
ncbi:putative manganese efflux pump MntP [Legionella gratiana]|uniref:Manganese efflux pump MntP n=2 Tax=Legionella gratiana TaxID=45066 RepID=A0A378JCK9_9GAMM|nr:putative manganese efflux pump MntP [Legionella gratiana]STX45355.1 putative sporulation protein YtaF [Legionella gratiana]